MNGVDSELYWCHVTGDQLLDMDAEGRRNQTVAADQRNDQTSTNRLSEGPSICQGKMLIKVVQIIKSLQP